MQLGSYLLVDMVAVLENFELKNIEAKLTTTNVATVPLMPEELDYLITCFVPSKSESSRIQAFRALSSLNDVVRSINSRKKGNSQDLTLAQLFRPAFDRRVIDVEESSFLEIISFNNALFVVDSMSAATFFQRDGYQDAILDGLDLFPDSEIGRAHV